MDAITTRLTLYNAVSNHFTTTTALEYILPAIEQVESEVNTKLRVRQQMGRSTASATSRFTSLPADFLGPIGLQLNDDPIRELPFLSSELMDNKKLTYTSAGRPRYWSVIGTEIELLPVPDAAKTIELSYWKKLDPLDADGATNWLLDSYPQIYLHGANAYVGDYVNDPRAATWMQKFEAGLESLRVEDDRARFPTGRLAARPRRVFS